MTDNGQSIQLFVMIRVNDVNAFSLDLNYFYTSFYICHHGFNIITATIDERFANLVINDAQ